MKYKRLTVESIELVAHHLAKKTMMWDEPIPDFGTRYPHVLEGCIGTPFQVFGGRYMYPGLTKKAAILFYLMIKNHPFKNGNKRIAMTTLFYFLFRHGRWLRVDNQELYNFAKWVAESNAKLKDATVSAIEKFLETYMIDFEK